MGRKCAVPHCYTGYRKCKEKASLYKVPDDDFFLNKWQEAIAREDRPITPKDYVCEKHFKEDDIQRTRVIKNVVEVYLRPKLRPDAIPSVFPDLPEFILKMVKKRRKMLPQDIKQKTVSEETTNKEDRNETDKEDQESEVKGEVIHNKSGAFEVSNNISNNEIEIKSENEDTAEKDEDMEDEDLNGPRTYKCDQCDYESKYSHNLRTHQSKHLIGEEAFIHCDICPDYKTKWELTYRNHMRIKHRVGSQEIFNCNLCDYKTRVKICLKRHMERHNKGLFVEGKFKCDFPECHYKCDSKALVKIHLLIHDEGEDEKKAFKCTECRYSTNSKTHILKHIKSAHNTGDDTVVSISTKKSDEPCQKKRRPNGKPLYRCVKCSFQTHYHALLLKHLVKHKEGETSHTLNISKVWKCSKCPYATFFQHALESHQQTDCEKNDPAVDRLEVTSETDCEEKDIFMDESEVSDETNNEKIITIVAEMEESNGTDSEKNATDFVCEKPEESLEENQDDIDENLGEFHTIMVKEEHE